MPLSLDAGPSTPPLPRHTIGAALDLAVERWGDREALVSVEQGLRYTYAELSHEVDRVARGLLARGVGKGDRVGIWSPNCAEWVLVQHATARIGAILVTVNPAYRTHELAYVLQQAGVSLLVAAPEFKGSDYVQMAAEAAPDVPAVFFGSPEWAALAVDGGPLDVPGAGAGRADQSPVHLRHDRVPQGRDALAREHPRQRLPRRCRLRLHRGRSDLRPGALLPLLRHGHGHPCGARARRLRGRPGCGVRAGGDAGCGRRGALHVALRRADDVHRRAGP